MVGKKHLILCLLAAVFLITAYVDSNQKTMAVQQKTMEEVFVPIGQFMKDRWDLLTQSVDSLVKDVEPDDVVAEVNGWPITAAELEFTTKGKKLAFERDKLYNYQRAVDAKR